MISSETCRQLSRTPRTLPQAMALLWDNASGKTHLCLTKEAGGTGLDGTLVREVRTLLGTGLSALPEPGLHLAGMSTASPSLHREAPSGASLEVRSPGCVFHRGSSRGVSGAA